MKPCRVRSPACLADCHNISDLRELARRRLPAPVFHFLDGAAEDEWTARRNVTSFDDIQLAPRCLVDVSVVDTRVRVLGQELEWPLFCSPTGSSRLFHADGELAVARAAAAAGTLYGVAAGSNYSLEEIMQVSRAPKMFLLYPCSDRDINIQLIQRCRAAGYGALCLVADVPIMGNRERDVRTGLRSWPSVSPASLLSIAAHPGWALRQLRQGRITFPHFAAHTSHDRAVPPFDPSLTWTYVHEIAQLWDGPLAIKGIMTPDDARRAADAGAVAIIVSNHGGRQLDGAAAPLDVLPDIVEAVGDRIEVILDGGIRRGTHILKALACGARACSIGRPYLYGLAAGGEGGVTRALHILRTELVRAMTLAGCPDVSAARAMRLGRRQLQR